MKKIVAIVASFLLILAVAIPLFAHHPGWGRGHHMMGYWTGGPGYCYQYGRGYDNLTEEQRGQLDKLHKQFHDATARLRNEIRAKQAELNMLLSSPNPDAEKAKALQKEFSDLRAKLAQKRITFELEVRKLAPKGHYGRGYSRGFGWHRGGHGPATCWN